VPKRAAAKKTAKKAPKKAPSKPKGPKTSAGGPKNKSMIAVRDFALGLPGAHEDFPWGERVVKVQKKVFAFLGHDQDDRVGFSVKLPHSAEAVLGLPFAEPTGYGLGKAGWVSITLPPGQKVPLDTLLAWIEESYRAVAPKKLAIELDGR
jgi:predicted DNA-binding protein (MmcQ/YjbR family)